MPIFIKLEVLARPYINLLVQLTQILDLIYLPQRTLLIVAILLKRKFFFQKSLAASNISFMHVPFTGSSLFGVHAVDLSTPNIDTWATPDVANFQVRVVRAGYNDDDAYFMLTGSAGGFFPILTSSIIKDVYNNSKWNLAVRIKPTSYPWADGVAGTSSPNYDIEFLGYNTVLESIDHQFKVTSSVSFADGASFLTSSKRAFVGAHRTNFTGTLLQRSERKNFLCKVLV